MINLKTVYLEISSWQDISMGAQHYYGELIGYNGDERKEVKLTRILTPRQAAKANRYRSSDSFLNVRAGDESDGFDEKDEIIKLALKVWLTHFPDAQLLIQGRISVAEPQEILACPAYPEIIESANKLYEEFEAIEGYHYKRNWKQAEEIDDKWTNLINQQTRPGEVSSRMNGV